MARLVMRLGEVERTRVLAGEPYVFRVPGVEARFEPDGGGWRVDGRTLKDGEEVTLGRWIVRYEAHVGEEIEREAAALAALQATGPKAPPVPRSAVIAGAATILMGLFMTCFLSMGERVLPQGVLALGVYAAGAAAAAHFVVGIGLLRVQAWARVAALLLALGHLPFVFSAAMRAVTAFGSAGHEGAPLAAGGLFVIALGWAAYPVAVVAAVLTGCRR